MQERRARFAPAFSLLIVSATLSGCAIDHHSGEIFVVRPTNRGDSTGEVPADNQPRAPSQDTSPLNSPHQGRGAAAVRGDKVRLASNVILGLRDVLVLECNAKRVIPEVLTMQKGPALAFDAN
jgi:hypothetical protein